MITILEIYIINIIIWGIIEKYINYLERIIFFYSHHMKSMDDLAAIILDTPRINNKCSSKKESTKLIHIIH